MTGGRFSGGGTHLTADRSDTKGRRRRRQKPIAQGGTAPHLGSCNGCGVQVIFHRRAGGERATIMLDTEPVSAERVHPDTATRYVIFMGAVHAEPDPRNVPEDMPFYRAHVCEHAAERT